MRNLLHSRLLCGGLTIATLWMAGLLAGCGGSSEPTPDKAAASSDDDKPSQDRRSSGSRSSDDSGRSGSTVASTAGPTIDGIPLDIYFDNPLEIAADQTVLGGGGGPAGTPATMIAAVDNGGTAPAAPAEAPMDKPAAGANVKWEDLISAEQLEGEVKAIRNELSTRLANFGAYGRAVLEVPVFCGTLAFVAHVADQHSGDIGWKPKAKVIRTLATKMAELTDSAEQRNRNTYDEVNNAFMMICSLLDRNDPAEQPEPDASAGIATIAPMGHLMKRIERGGLWLQTNTGTEDSLKSKVEVAQREVAMIAAIGEVFTNEDYGYGDDEEFVGHSHQMRDAALGMLKGIASETFSDYDLGRSKVSQKCTECHSVYRNG